MAGHINLTNILNNIYNQTTRWELQAKWQHECAAWKRANYLQLGVTTVDTVATNA